MPNESVTHFLDLVKRVGLVSRESLETLFHDVESAPSPQSVASILVEKNLLTPFQAERLLQGMPEDLVLADRYVLLEKIGSGGMGAVYRAKDTRLNRIVAIKLMAPHNLSQPDAVVRFKREARALAQLALPHIVQAFDSGEDRGRNFLVMEFVQGIGLDKVVREKGKIPPTVAADYVYQTAIGMQRAHERGMIHRDIKPGNLLLTPDGDVKILDLGLARFLQDQIPEAEVTRDNIGMGTPDYMPPEQFRDAHNVDPRADIYSLGCTLYHLIAGRPPFPGSSLSEKMEAHSTREAPALTEFAPEIPVGLMRTIERMMAKRPVDRIQRMSEVAEALAPYVAGSSASLPSVNQTLTWQASQLSTAKRRRPMMLAGIGALLVLVTALAVWGVSQLWKKDTQQPIAKLPTPSPGPIVSEAPTPIPTPKPSPSPTEVAPPSKEKEPSGKKVEPERKEPEKKEPEPPTVVTIPNGLTVAQDGTGQHKTIAEALEEVQKGQTIRVLDDATYTEALMLNRSQFAGITVEAVRGAKLALPEGSKNQITIGNVPGVTVRGFHMQLAKLQSTFVWIHGKCPGTVIEKNVMSCKPRKVAMGVEYAGDALGEHDMPVVIRDNEIRDAEVGAFAHGCAPPTGYSTPFLKNRLRIENNRFIGCRHGVILMGQLQQIQVVGNQFSYCERLAIELENLLEKTQGILVANNSTVECGEALRVWDKDIGGKDVVLCNNLILSSRELDMIFVDSGGNPTSARGAGNGALVLERWSLHDNWREHQGNSAEKAWIPKAPKDVMQPKIDVLSRKPADKDFLRPAKDSPLAKEGAGKSNAAFPSYVGAVAPEGAEPWNWQRTWDIFFEKQITVSKDPKDGALYASLRDALAASSPGMTVRILDDAVYVETLTLDDPARHRGLTIEALKGAVLELEEGEAIALLIDSVPDVTVRGLHLRAKRKIEGVINFLALIQGDSPGVVCEKLTAESASVITVVGIKNAPLKKDDKPIVVRDCRFKVGGTGVLIAGLPGVLTRNVLVHDNYLQCEKGIGFEQAAQDVLIAGNTILNSTMACIEIRGPFKECRNNLFANNTCFGGQCGIRIWMEHADKRPYTVDEFTKGQVDLVANVIVKSQILDVALVDANPKSFGPRDGDFLNKLWIFDSNWRDMKAAAPFKNLARAEKDHKVSEEMFQSLARANADFLKPVKGGDLTTGGAGKTMPGLPAYAGAIPPDGTPAWDWRETWRTRFEKK